MNATSQTIPAAPRQESSTIATPNGNNPPTLYGCSVVDAGARHSGAILVGSVDDAAANWSRFNSFGTYNNRAISRFASSASVRRLMIALESNSGQIPDQGKV
jgi:hypothetical protein